MTRFLRGLKAPSWTVVAVTLLIAATAFIGTMGPDMISRGRFERLYLGADAHDAVKAARRSLESERADIVETLRIQEWQNTYVPRTIADMQSGIELSLSWPEGLAYPQDAYARELMGHATLRRLVGEPIAIGKHAYLGGNTNPIALMGERDGVTYCLTVEGIPESGLERATFPIGGNIESIRRPRMLGGCTFVHRYGLPGRQVLELLKQRGGAVAPWGLGVTTINNRFDPLSLGGMFLDSWYYGGAVLARRACMHGDLEICGSEFVLRDAVDTSAPAYPATVDHYVRRSGVLTEITDDLFSALEEEFGDAAFMKFWTSDDPVIEAFESAFGVPSDIWVQQRVRAAERPVTPGPLPGAHAAGTTFGFSVVSILLATLFTRRRKIG